MAVAVLIAYGLACRYDPGVMDAVIANRVGWDQLPPGTDVARSIALIDCDRIGETVWVETPQHTIIRAVVADCAKANHRDALEARGFALDLSHELAMELGVTNGPVGGYRVWSADPRTGRR